MCPLWCICPFYLLQKPGPGHSLFYICSWISCLGTKYLYCKFRQRNPCLLHHRKKISTNLFARDFLQPTCKNDMCHLSMWESLVFFINAIKKNKWEVHAIKTTCNFHILRDTCHFYILVVRYFLQTNL
jgi:hypothetical protein